jgi:hypothetical protein
LEIAAYDAGIRCSVQAWVELEDLGATGNPRIEIGRESMKFWDRQVRQSGMARLLGVAEALVLVAMIATAEEKGPVALDND